MLAEQPALDGMPTPPSPHDTPAAPARTAVKNSGRPPISPAPTLDEATGPERSGVHHMHVKGNPPQYDLDILRVVLSSVGAIERLLTSRPQGNITPIFTSGHNQYTQLALLPSLSTLAHPYLTDDERNLLVWAQRQVHHEATLRISRKRLPTPNTDGIKRLRTLLRHLQCAIDALAINAPLRRTAAIRRTIAEELGAEAAEQSGSGTLALV